MGKDPGTQQSPPQMPSSGPNTPVPRTEVRLTGRKDRRHTLHARWGHQLLSPSSPWYSQPGTSGPPRCGPVSPEPTGHLPKGQRSPEAYNTESSEWCRSGTQGWLPYLLGPSDTLGPGHSSRLPPRGAQSSKEKALDRAPVALQGCGHQPGLGLGGQRLSREQGCRLQGHMQQRRSLSPAPQGRAQAPAPTIATLPSPALVLRQCP